MKVQVIVVGPIQRRFLKNDADTSEIDFWLEQEEKYPTEIEFEPGEELSPEAIVIIKNAIDDAIIQDVDEADESQGEEDIE